jgi:hypothetical protein
MFIQLNGFWKRILSVRISVCGPLKPGVGGGRPFLRAIGYRLVGLPDTSASTAGFGHKRPLFDGEIIQCARLQARNRERRGDAQTRKQMIPVQHVESPTAGRISHLIMVAMGFERARLAAINSRGCRSGPCLPALAGTTKALSSYRVGPDHDLGEALRAFGGQVRCNRTRVIEPDYGTTRRFRDHVVVDQYRAGT